ncbi:hypothetical protein FRC00_011346 [Tulasnella sp. 408]|nr:hypothetical protein FRC00_011346 [Tulasnella sp. 408]
MSNPEREPKLTTIPKVPDKFGEDGGKFYTCYEAMADELDEEMVKGLKSQLDSILIFAGLFAGVNTAFLAFTLPDMSADPADDTNALLLQLVIGGQGTILSADDLPSATFAPSPGIVPVNVLFSLSLTLAIIVSFVAILGQQWIVYYRKRSGGGIEHQRLEQLQRYLGANRWNLEGVLDGALPALLQLALAIFCLALVMYTRTLSTTMCLVIGIPLAIALAILFVASMIGAEMDPWCPFTHTLSRFIRFIFEKPRRYWPLIFVLSLVRLAVALPFFLLSWVAEPIAMCLLMGVEIFGTTCARTFFPEKFNDPFDREFASRAAIESVLQSFTRSGPLARDLKKDPLGDSVLQAAAVKRVLCTSSDFNTLIHTAINIQAMNAKEGAQYLLDDDAVHEHLEKLVKSSDEPLASAFCYAFAHLLLLGQSAELFVRRMYRLSYGWMMERYSLTDRYCELHPLKKQVRFICEKLKTSMASGKITSGNFVGYQFYFERLELILNEQSDNTKLIHWLDDFVQKHWTAEISTTLVICLVADTVCRLNKGFELRSASSELQASQPGPDSEQDQNNCLLTVQNDRVVIAKELIDAIVWNLQLLPSDPQLSPSDPPLPPSDMQVPPSDPQQSDRTSALGLIEEAFNAYTDESPRHPDNAEIWLLEQALSFSAESRHQRGLQFVAESSVGLLPTFDKLEDPTPDSVNPRGSQKDTLRPPFDKPEYTTPDSANTQDSQKGNLLLPSAKSEDPTPNTVNTMGSNKAKRRRCVEILSQCIQAALPGNLVRGRFIRTVSPALNKLEAYWGRFKDDFTQNPDLNDSDTFSSWLKIRAALDRSEESTGWGAHNMQPFGEAYPNLKIGFDTIDARQPNSGEWNEQPHEQAGPGNSKAMD